MSWIDLALPHLSSSEVVLVLLGSFGALRSFEEQKVFFQEIGTWDMALKHYHSWSRYSFLLCCPISSVSKILWVAESELFSFATASEYQNLSVANLNTIFDLTHLNQEYKYWILFTLHDLGITFYGLSVQVVVMANFLAEWFLDALASLEFKLSLSVGE